MAANKELARERGGRGEGEEDGDGDDGASFFELELTPTGHLTAAFDDGGHVTRQLAPEQLGPVARLRALVRKLRKPTVAWLRPATASGGAPAAPVKNRCLVKAGTRTAGQLGMMSAVAAGERRTTKVAALKLYLAKMVTLARRRGGRDGADPPPPPSHPLPTPAVLSGRSSRAEACDAAPVTGLRLAGKPFDTSRSAAIAMLPPPPKRRDDSLLQAQDGIASAIAHCKLSLDASRGFESPKVFRG